MLSQLVRDGKLQLSLKDAIRLALENNLDLAIARYNLPIANMDILRTKAGGVFRGVNTARAPEVRRAAQAEPALEPRVWFNPHWVLGRS